MDLLNLRAQIEQGQARLSEIATQLNCLSADELDSLSSTLIPLLTRLNAPPGETLSPLSDLTPDQFKSTLDAVSAGVLVYDRNRIIRYVNQRAIRYIGYDPTGETRDQYLNKLKLTDWKGQPLSINDRPANAVWDGFLAQDIQMMITNLDGQVFQVLVTAIPFFQLGAFSGAVVIWNDVTLLEQAILEVKRREAQLRESEERFRIALANASVFVYTQDRDLHYTWVYSPYHPEEAQWVLGKWDDVMLPNDDLPELKELKRQVIETGVGFRKEIRRMVEGEPRVFDMTCEALYDITGQISGLTGATIDITERRRLEARQDEYAARIELYHRLMEKRDQNLLHFAQKIQDGPLQSTISLIAAIQLAREISPDQQVIQVMDEAEIRAKELAIELRRVCSELNPPAATRFGFMRAIQAHTLDLQKRYPGIIFELNLMEDILKLSDTLYLALYRIYREAVQNAIQHAGASVIAVRLSFSSAEIVLEIEDDGAGFSPSTNWMELVQNGQFGLVGMKEQADSIHARLSLTSSPSSGTVVRVTVPYSG